MTPSRQCKPAHLPASWRALLVLCFCTLAGPATAVTLGQESILSALGDPIEVEIDVLQWDDVDLERVQIALASPAEYESFRLSWLPVLDELDFNLIGPNTRGEVKVLVSTRELVAEPYVELLLVLRWPGGSLLREYVLLFDLPETRSEVIRQAVEEPLPADTPPVRETAADPLPVDEPVVPATAADRPAVDEPLVVDEPPVAPARVPTPAVVVPEPEPESESAIAATPAAPAAAAAPVMVEVQETADDSVQAAPEPRNQGAIVVTTATPVVQSAAPATGRRVYQVREGDGLWSIAQQFQPAGAGENIYQMLLSLHDLNRAAFINGNISLLKANTLLQIPAIDDIEAIDAATAESLFERRWAEGTTRLQTALRGDPLPAFSELYESERIEEGPQAEQEARVPGEESGRIAGLGEGGLLLPSDTPVVVPLAEAPAQAGDLLLDESVVQVTQQQVPAAAGTATADRSEAAAVAPVTVNPYLERIDGSARDLQTLLQNRSMQVARLEEQLVEMRQRMRDAQQVTSRLNLALEQALQKQNGERQGSAALLGSLALVLLAALIIAMVMLLKLTAQLRSQRKLWAGDAALTDAFDDIPEPGAGDSVARPARQEHPPVDGIVVHEESGMSARDDEDEYLQQELLEIIGPATRDQSGPHDHNKVGS